MRALATDKGIPSKIDPSDNEPAVRKGREKKGSQIQSSTSQKSLAIGNNEKSRRGTPPEMQTCSPTAEVCIGRSLGKLAAPACPAG